MTFDDYLNERLSALRAAGLLRTSDEGLPGDFDACSNDYLGLARGAVSRETAPVGAAASRLIHGTAQAHRDLEHELADWLSAPAALLFSSGYAANVGLISAIFNQGGTVISDRANHASIIDGCRLSRARVVVEPHLALDAFEAALREHAGTRPLAVVVESYFSMDGDGPDLRALRGLCDRHGAFLFVDEAHALGVFGAEGSGLCSQAGVRPDVVIGGLGKAVGGQGGFVAGSLALRGLLWNAARSFVFSTATSPLLSQRVRDQVVALRAADPARAQLHTNCQQLRERLRAAGLPTVPGSFGPIVPLVVGDSSRAVEVCARLAQLGIRAQAIRPPTVPEGSARIRVTVKSWFTPADVERLAAGLESACRE